MIVTESLIINNTDFIKTYSDAGRYVVREGVSYIEAYDPAIYGRTYTEGDYINEDATESDYISALNEMGVEV